LRSRTAADLLIDCEEDRTFAFTMDTYQHLMPTMQEQAVRAIEEAIGGTVAAGSKTASCRDTKPLVGGGGFEPP
jgi:hypothetical protein